VGSVLAAVHHAEVVAHRVGEPFGSLVLAVAVTVIEVALVVTLMVSGAKGAETLARDTVFAAVMVTTTGIVGLSILLATTRGRVTSFNAAGSGSALGVVAVLAVLTLVLPSMTTSSAEPVLSAPQLVFVALVSLALYGLFVLTQSVRHRDYFMPPESASGNPDEEAHAPLPSRRTALVSLALLVCSLVSVVGLAKVESPVLEAAVASAGLPQAAVGVAIALVVLLPESIAAARAARRGRVQTSMNLALGSAMASIGLTIPAIAVASIWLPTTLVLGLSSLQVALLALALLVSVITLLPGRATVLQGGVHLAVCAAFLLFAAVP
jgi:Ca2+:H+ antiporter